VNTIWERIKNEPALVISLLAATVQGLQAEDVIRWETIATVIAGVLIRQFVTPTERAEDQAEQSFRLGTIAGRENP
jgi:hypothetical protein